MRNIPNTSKLTSGITVSHKTPNQAVRVKLLLCLLTLGLSLSLGTAQAQAQQNEPEEHISKLSVKRSGIPVTLNGTESIRTEATFKPPVEITVVAKTDSTNLRLGYAADQMIFNWERNPHELRMDGGPADKKHKIGAGLVPTNKYVTVRWVVTKDKQTVYVDDQMRYEHSGDYSQLDNPVIVFSNRSKVSVRSILVKDLSPKTKENAQAGAPSS